MAEPTLSNMFTTPMTSIPLLSNTNSTMGSNETIIPSQCTLCVVVKQIIKPIIFALITFFGILGNGLVMYVILSRQKMRTVTNLLLLNLAIADLSFLVICPPFTAYQDVMGHWGVPGQIGVIICKLMNYLLNVTVYVTIYTLVLISVIRYLTIVHNNTTREIRTRGKIIIMIIAIWVIMIGSNIPIWFAHGIYEDGSLKICAVLSLDSGKIIYTVFFIVAYLLPLMVIAIFSLCILHHIKKQRPTVLSKKASRSSQKKKKAGRVLILVVVIFAIFWLPIHIYLVLFYWGLLADNEIVDASGVVWQCLAYFNSCVNPVIYNYASQDFRESFREVVCCRRRGGKYGEGETHRNSVCTKAEATAMCPNGQNKTTVTYFNEDEAGSDLEAEKPAEKV